MAPINRTKMLRAGRRPFYPELPTFKHLEPLGQKIAIIGHGRSPEGKAWADRIDSCDTVIRMWDCQWCAAEDYGTRYDIGLFEIGTELVETFLEHKQQEPTRGWIASFLCRSTVAPPENTEVVDQKPWNEIGTSLGGSSKTGRLQFTRGTIATCWAVEHAESGAEIVLVGFDNIARGKTLDIHEAYSPAYRANPGTFTFRGYKGGDVKFGNHDYRCERPVMFYLAEQRGIKLSFAQEAWT